MARLWSCGAELQSITNNVEWDITTSVNSRVSISTTTVRSGAAAIRFNNTVSTDDNASITYDFLASGGSTNNIYVRMYFRIASATSSNITTILALRDVAAAVNVASLMININNTLELWDFGNNTQIGSDSSALSTNTWYRLELEYQFHATTPTVIGYINGASFASGTLVNNGNNNPSQLTIGNTRSNRTFDFFVDDIAINDSSGSFATGLPGEGEIIHLNPDAAGDNNAFAKDGGGAGDTNNFNQMDEITPDDATTNLESTGTSGILDDYNLSATPVALASDDTINVVQVGYRGRAETAGDADGIVLRIKASSGGTVEEGSNIIMNGTTWKTNANATPRAYSLTLYDLPGASTTVWTKTDLDAAQIGMKADAAGVVTAEPSTLWLLVDHKPTAAGETITLDKWNARTNDPVRFNTEVVAY